MERFDLADPASRDRGDRSDAQDRRAGADAAGAVASMMRIRRVPRGAGRSLMFIVRRSVIDRHDRLMVRLRGRQRFRQCPERENPGYDENHGRADQRKEGGERVHGPGASQGPQACQHTYHGYRNTFRPSSNLLTAIHHSVGVDAIGGIREARLPAANQLLKPSLRAI